MINFFAQLALSVLDLWLKKNAKNKEMVESYYNFLKQVDKNGALKVSNYLASEELLKQTQEQLKNNLEMGKQ